MLLAVTVPGAPPALAAPAEKHETPKAQAERSVGGHSAKPVAVPEPPSKPFKGDAPVWPEAGTATVDFGAAGAQTVGAAREVPKAGALPVWLEPAKKEGGARVDVLDRGQAKKAGVDGLLVRVTGKEAKPAAGVAAAREDAAGTKAKVTLDYSKFRNAYGGDWASRLRLVKVPECGLSTPEKKECRPEPVAGAENNLAAGKVSAFMGTQGSTLLGVTAPPSGPAGDYGATSLTSSATWSGGGNSGDFTWSYALRSPPALGGPAPSVAFGYSSASVDGRMAASNNQPSWLGEGWDWDPGAIERKYIPCASDMTNSNNNTEKTGDQCWGTDNATLAMSGHAGELIKDATNPNRWHLRNDDGTYVERRTGSGNGAKDGEFWVVTTTDGVQYWFGKSAQSTLTVPVAGNNPGEPCRANAFADSFCTQAYRWNLEYVVDLLGNTLTYTYGKETNKYSKNLKTDQDPVQYDRSSYLQRIDYGTRSDRSESAPMQIVFETADRCKQDCGNHNAVNWPDTPWDQECTAKPCNTVAPTFWSTKRLSKVITKTGGNPVEEWALTHTFEDPGDGTRAGLWLQKISHKGLVGQTTPVPDVVFTGTQMHNRVDTVDHSASMNWWRIKSITTESGGLLTVSYSERECVAGSNMPDTSNLQDNKKRCYPVRWHPDGEKAPVIDFFHKYVVTDVTEDAIFGGNIRAITHFDYVGDPAWHYSDDDGMVKAEDKTWSVWRGYGAVRTTKGDPGEQEITESRFFRGMHGDKYGSGTRNVDMPAAGGAPSMKDEDVFAGMTRETIVYNGTAEVSGEVYVPWQSSKDNATRTFNGVTVKAKFTSPAGETYKRTALDGGRQPMTTSTVTTFDDDYGTPKQSEDRGTPATGDEGCTIVSYARNTGAAWLIGAVSREQRFATDCTRARASGLTEQEVLADELTFYDGQAHGAAPTKGLTTKTQVLKAYQNGTPSYVDSSTSAYDAYGRPTRATDLRGGATTREYTPAAGGPLTQVKETSPLGWTKTETFQPAWHLPLTSVDANGRKVEFAYDGLGRLTSVWKAGRDRSQNQSANITYEYLVRNDAASAVTSKRLNAYGGYITSHEIFDGMWRKRQTQTPDAAGGPGTMLTDTYHDSAGRVSKQNDAYYSGKISPSTALYIPEEVIPAQTVSVYDGAGRVTDSILKTSAPQGGSNGGTEKWRTKTYFAGDRTDVTPPLGATATSTVADAFGRTGELRQYRGPVPTPGVAGSYDRTVYEYDRKDRLSKVTSPAGAVWTYEHDLVGRTVKTTDPDKGTSTSVYNDAGDLLSTTDGRGTTLAFSYDTIGRKTGVYKDSVASGNKRAEWFYDSLSNGDVVKGQLVKAVRYQGADAYAKETLSYTTDYQPTFVKHTIPGTKVGGSYTYTYTYNQDGTPATVQFPQTADLKAETLTYGYDSLGQPVKLDSKYGGELLKSMVTGTSYTSWGEVGAYTLKSGTGSFVDVVKDYEPVTRRLRKSWAVKQIAPATIADVTYAHNPAGDVTSVSDSVSGDTQCFTMDHLRRLTEAWTPASHDCNAAPSNGSLGGPAKYWHTYEVDAAGNRKKLVEHETATGDRTTTYTVNPGKHSLASTATADNTGTKTKNWSYDPMGNMLTRPTPSDGTQTMTWDVEGRLDTSTDASGTTSYVYDVDGNRILRQDPLGTTLYLPGQEVRNTSSTGLRTTTRQYSQGGGIIANRVAGGLTWIVGDTAGTAEITVNEKTQAVGIRRTTPYGAERQKSGTWPTWFDKGFAGGTQDNTGLTHIGAREYDPDTGRFVSVDPVIDNNDPQQLHGYAYGNNNPSSNVDADGRWGLPKFVKNAVSSVKNSVSNVVSTVGEAAKATGKWVYNNAGTISTVLSVAAVACTVIPPLQVAAPFLGAAATAVGAIETYKSCSEGMSVDCAMGLTELVPGGRVAGKAAEGARDAAKAGKRTSRAADEAGGAAETVSAVSCPIGGGGGKKGHSFDPATPVLMADGSTKEIAAVQTGDQVLATDPGTGESTAQPVTDLHRNLDIELTDLTVTKSDGTSALLQTTQNHPFWDATTGQWADAAQLEPGHLLLSSTGELVRVTTVRNFAGVKEMRDLTVATIHTYYVVAAGLPVLVHNINNGSSEPIRSTKWCDGQDRNADGESLEDDVANMIEDDFPGEVKGQGDLFRKESGKRWTDHDVYGQNWMLEVHDGVGNGKVSQFKDNHIPTAKSVGRNCMALYCPDPNLKGSIKKGLERLGIVILTTRGQLRNWMRAVIEARETGGPPPAPAPPLRGRQRDLDA